MMGFVEVAKNILLALIVALAVVVAVLFMVAIATGRTDNPHKGEPKFRKTSV